MFAVISKGNAWSPYLRATSAAVGHKVVQIPVDPHHDPPIVPQKCVPADASSIRLNCGDFKGVSASVNALQQVRLAHTDIKIPDFDSYRRDSTKNPKKASRDSVVDRQTFSYLMTAGFGVVSAVIAKTSAHSVIGMMSPSKDVLALAKVEVKLSEIPEGKNIVVKWRGKPLFIRHRTAAEIAKERAVDVSSLRHAETDEQRVKQDKWLVVLGVCTHLGCVPIAYTGDYGGYFCPCHGSHYDVSGRIRKGPAPLNLEVPPYEFQDNILVVG